MNIQDVKKLRFAEGDLITPNFRDGAIWKAIRIDSQGVVVTLHSCKAIPQEDIDSGRRGGITSMDSSDPTEDVLWNPFMWSKATPKQLAEWRCTAEAQKSDPSQQTDEAPYGKL